jgi:UDP-glucose 4-epimerase
VLSSPRILVWGPFGFIGSNLTAALLSRGHRVTILSRPLCRYEDPGWVERVECFELHDGDDNAATIRQAVSGVSVVYDLAGMSGAVASNRAPIKSLEDDCRRHLELLDACERAGNRPHVVFPSTRLVYGETGREPVTEEHPLSPRCIYAAHRACIENYLQIYAGHGEITYTICRISNAYGHARGRVSVDYGVLNGFIRRALNGQPVTLFGDGSQLRDYIYIADLVEALIRCGTRAAASNQLFNIGAGSSVTMRDAVFLIRELTGSPPVQFAPWPEDWRAVELGDYLVDTQKARTLLGVSCAYDFAAGLAETVDLYRRSQTVTANSGLGPERLVR